MSKTIYFDNSATTKIFKEAAESMLKTMETYYANPSSLHALGNQAHRLLESARKQAADILGCSPEEVFFTGSGTESDNWAVKGTALEKAGAGKHLITSQVEHPAIMNTMQALEKQGFEVTYLPVDKEGKVHAEDLKAAIRPDTTLVSVMAINNEIGSQQPIAELAEVLEDYPSIHFHVDGVQSFMKTPLPLIHSRVDLMSFSAHKFNGPRGCGILYKKANRQILPLLDGGGQEHLLRSSTENLPAIVATVKAMRLTQEGANEESKRHQAFQDRLRQFLAEEGDQVTVFSPQDGAAHILCFALKGVRGEVMVHALEEEGIYVSTTSACASRKSQQGSSTLAAMPVDPSLARCAIRLSFGHDNRMEEVEDFIEVYRRLLHKFAKIQ